MKKFKLRPEIREVLTILSKVILSEYVLMIPMDPINLSNKYILCCSGLHDWGVRIM